MPRRAVTAACRAATPWLCLAAIISTSACVGATEPPEPPPKPAATAPIGDWIAWCGAVGAFAVKTAATAKACDNNPAVGAQVSIAVKPDGTAWLSTPAMVVPLTSHVECAFVGHGCLSTARDWVAGDAVVAVANGEAQVKLAVTAVRDHAALDCPSAATLTAAKVVAPACGLDGSWKMTAAPAIVKGACAIAWPAGEFTIARGAGGWTLSWPGSDLARIAVDEKACTATVRPSADVSSWNGAARTTTATLRLVGDQIAGTIAD